MSGRLAEVGGSSQRAWPAHGLVVVRVDGGQPGDKRLAQRLELVLLVGGIAGQQVVDLGLHDLFKTADRLIVGSTESAVGTEVAVEAVAESAPATATRQRCRRYR